MHLEPYRELEAQTFKCNEKSFGVMFNKKNEITLSALVVSVILVASFFAISFVQQALAQGNLMHKDNPQQIPLGNCPKCGASNTTSSGNSTSNTSTTGK